MSAHRFISFDIEIAQEIPKGERDWNVYRPLGISCAAVHWDRWSTADIIPACKNVMAIKSEGSSWNEEEFLPRMTEYGAKVLVDYLVVSHERMMMTPLTFNGMGFDFSVLAEESGEYIKCVELALDHVDIFFQIFCLQGYAPGLDAVAKGMGLPGKTKDMDGAKAPVLWARGEYGKVMEYVAQDARMTLEVAKAVEKEGEIRWRSRSGEPKVIPIERWLTVRECLELPEPDVSWMDDPWYRTKFTEWMAGYA